MSRWYLRAAEAGHPLAMVRFGRLGETGRGIAQDDAMARHRYAKAAAAGHVGAADRLGG